MNDMRRKIEFFWARDAGDPAKAGISGSVEMSDATLARMEELAALGAFEGVKVENLAYQKDGFSILLVWYKPGFIVPRHSHDTDCMYYIQTGTASMGERTLGPGDSVFIPGGTVYTFQGGPEGCQLLEIRHGPSEWITRFGDQPDTWWERMRANCREQAPQWEPGRTPPLLRPHLGNEMPTGPKVPAWRKPD